MKIKIKKLNPLAILPTKAHSTDAGFDLYATSKAYDENGNVVYGCGLAFEIPEGYMGFGTDSLPDVYFTGFMEQLYMYGWLGVGLLFMYLVWLCLSSRGFARIVMILFTSLYFVAGVSGFIPVVFYIGTVLTFVRNQDE